VEQSGALDSRLLRRFVFPLLHAETAMIAIQNIEESPFTMSYAFAMLPKQLGAKHR
jgi:hypothetical protein